MPVFPDLTDEERTRSTFALIPPTLCFGTAPDQCFFFLVRPKSAQTIDVEIGYIFHPSALDDPLFEEKVALSDAGVQVFVRQDQDATMKVQNGLNSRFAPRGRYSWQEESHVQFNRWLVQRYRLLAGQHVATVVAAAERRSGGFSMRTTVNIISTPMGRTTMSRTSKKLLALLVPLALVAAACGGDDDAPAAEPTDAPSNRRRQMHQPSEPPRSRPRSRAEEPAEEPTEEPAEEPAEAPETNQLITDLRCRRRWHRHDRRRRRRPARRQRLLPVAGHVRRGVLGRQRVRGTDRERQHRFRRGRSGDVRPRRPGRRHHLRRRQRDR